MKTLKALAIGMGVLALCGILVCLVIIWANLLSHATGWEGIGLIAIPVLSLAYLIGLCLTED